MKRSGFSLAKKPDCLRVTREGTHHYVRVASSSDRDRSFSMYNSKTDYTNDFKSECLPVTSTYPREGGRNLSIRQHFLGSLTVTY